MRIFLITDIHHGNDTNYEKFGGLEYINGFGNAFISKIDQLLLIMRSCDLVVNLGDLIHNENPEKDIFLYKEALAQFPVNMPVLHVFGNHDTWDISRQQLASLISQDNSYYSLSVGGYRHIVLDSNRLGKTGAGIVSEEQIEWLDMEIFKAQEPVIIYTHYPIYNADVTNSYYFCNNPDRSRAINGDKVRACIEKYSKVKGVFNGHTHFGDATDIRGIPYITIPSFSENNGAGLPSGVYSIVTINEKGLYIEEGKI